MLKQLSGVKAFQVDGRAMLVWAQHLRRVYKDKGILSEGDDECEDDANAEAHTHTPRRLRVAFDEAAAAAWAEHNHGSVPESLVDAAVAPANDEEGGEAEAELMAGREGTSRMRLDLNDGDDPLGDDNDGRFMAGIDDFEIAVDPGNNLGAPEVRGCCAGCMF
jgi:hypothetical protein